MKGDQWMILLDKGREVEHTLTNVVLPVPPSPTSHHNRARRVKGQHRCVKWIVEGIGYAMSAYVDTKSQEQPRKVKLSWFNKLIGSDAHRVRV